MYYPKLRGNQKETEMHSQFLGYDTRDSCPPYAFREMQNMSSRGYPLLQTRHQRTVFQSNIPFLQAMTTYDGRIVHIRCGTEDDDVPPVSEIRAKPVGGGTELVLNLTMDPDASPKSIVQMGAYLTIWPDKCFVNAEKWFSGAEMTEGVDYGSLEMDYALESGEVYVRLCNREGGLYSGTAWSDEAPEDPINGMTWVDTSSGDDPSRWVLKQWSESIGMWTTIPETWIKISGIADTSSILQEDGLAFSYPDRFYDPIDGVTEPNQLWIASDQAAAVKKLDDGSLMMRGMVGIRGQYDPQASVDDAIYTIRDLKEQTIGEIIGRWDEAEAGGSAPSRSSLLVMTLDELMIFAEFGGLTLECIKEFDIHRTVPDMNFVVESGNRLWGCFYGQKDGKPINEIYASALGSPQTWNRFAGISIDSYVASRGADGAFTGAITFGTTPLFFRETGVEKVYPSTSGAHQILYTPLDGVQSGCGRSLVIVNNVLYYKAARGIMAYDGTLPRLRSEEFGETRYYEAVAGRMEDKYCVSMKGNTGGLPEMFVFDTAVGLWHREDFTQIICCASTPDNLYFAAEEEDSTYSILSVLPAAATVFGSDERMEWSAVTGNIGMRYAGKKYVTRIDIRLEMERGSEFKVFVQYDSDGKWLYSGSAHGQGLKTAVIPIRSRRCDHASIMLTGCGQVKVYSIQKTIEKGSDY